MPGKRLSGAAVATVLVVLGFSLPAGAQAVPAPSPGLQLLKVRSSQGYQLTLIANKAVAGRDEDEGEIFLMLNKGDRAAAIYRTSGTVTDTTVDANLGRLGRISIRRVETNRTRFVRRSCRGREKRKIEVVRYRGTIEFRGEEGFTEASATGASFDYGTYLRFACAIREAGGSPGKRLPGARLDVHRFPEDRELMLHATQSRPGSRTAISVQIDEVRGKFEITRAIGILAGPGALRFDRDLRRATLAPPAPFAGHATFRRNAPRAKRWTGNLTVDLPGDSNYPLTGRGIRVELEHPRV